jgi:hypothetical protein
MGGGGGVDDIGAMAAIGKYDSIASTTGAIAGAG